MTRYGAYAGALAVVAFMMGGIIMSLEMVASRYLTPFFGGAITTWGAIISTVLAALSIGYYLGGALADRHPHPTRLGVLTLPAAIYMAALPGFAPDFALWTAESIADIRWGVMTASVVLFCPPLVLLGAYSPFIIRLVIRHQAHSGRIAGLIYAVSTVGSIVGTLVTTFYLVPQFGTRAITLGLSAAAAACAVALFALARTQEAGDVAGRRSSLGTRLAAGTGMALYLAVAFLVLSANGASAAPIKPPEPAPGTSVHKAFFALENQIAFVESPYNTIIVLEKGDYRTMQFGYRQRRYTETRINKNDVTELPVEYTRTMTAALAYAREQNSLAMIGLGGGSTTRYLAHFMPDLDIDVVEIDPDVIVLAETYFNVEPGDRYRVTAMDGRLFLTRRPARYDIIMVDAYRGWFVPFHLTTVEFYELAKRRLSPGGVLAQNIEPTTLLFDSTIATLTAVFDHVDIYKGGYNVVALGYDGPKKEPSGLGARARALQDSHGFRYPLPDLLAGALPLDYDDGKLPLTDDFAPANMLHVSPRE